MFEKIYKKENEFLSKYSTIKIGGKARYIVFPKNISEVKYAISQAKENGLKYFLLGNGSNTLFDDEGFDGVVVCLKNCNRIQKKCDYVLVDAGVNLFALNIFLANSNLGGLEWSYGIPGTLGGLVCMNGGSFGHEIGESVEELLVLDENLRLKYLKKYDLSFKYRSSNLEKYTILKVKLKLSEKKTDSVFKKMQECYEKKKNTQPCDMPSLGSVFKHFEKDGKIFYPAKIIDELNLKGFSVGGAQVSQKHSGFVVNAGNAKSEDVKKLIEILLSKMNEMGVYPETEIVILNKWVFCL